MSEQNKTVKKNETKTENKKTKVKKPFKFTFSNSVLIAGIIVISIPVFIFLYIIVSAYMDTGSLHIGSRFDGDLNPKIEETQLSQIEEKIELRPEVESLEISLKVATLRVTVDVQDDLPADEYVELLEKIRLDVITVLDEPTYFTFSNAKTMYDYEIHLYNLSDNRDSDEFVYYILNKSNTMIEPVTQLVSEPLNPEFSEDIRQAAEDKKNPPVEDDAIPQEGLETDE